MTRTFSISIVFCLALSAFAGFVFVWGVNPAATGAPGAGFTDTAAVSLWTFSSNEIANGYALDTGTVETNHLYTYTNTSEESSLVLVTNSPQNYERVFVDDFLNRTVNQGYTNSKIGVFCAWLKWDGDNDDINLLWDFSDNTRVTYLAADLDARPGADVVSVICQIDGVSKWRFDLAQSLMNSLTNRTLFSVHHNGVSAWAQFGTVSQSMTWITTTDQTAWFSNIYSATTPATNAGFGRIINSSAYYYKGRLDRMAVYTNNWTAEFASNLVAYTHPTNNQETQPQ